MKDILNHYDGHLIMDSGSLFFFPKRAIDQIMVTNLDNKTKCIIYMK